MSQIGVFQWIRESVRRAVLLGFSDAVDQIGAPPHDQPLNPQLAGVLRDAAPQLSSGSATAVLSPGQKPARKRLGRSLSDRHEG